MLAVVIGSLAAYGLSRFRYQFAWMRNKDISFFFLSQLILPPVVLALPFLVLYKELALLDTRIGLILLYTLMVLPIVIWIMRDQFNTIPIELEEAALVDGLSIWGAFLRIVLPIALPGMVAAFILSLVLCWNEYFFAALLTRTERQDAAGDGRQPDRLAGHQLVVDGGALDRGDRAAGGHRHPARALHHQGHDRRRGEIATLRLQEAGIRSKSLFFRTSERGAGFRFSRNCPTTTPPSLHGCCDRAPGTSHNGRGRPRHGAGRARSGAPPGSSVGCRSA